MKISLVRNHIISRESSMKSKITSFLQMQNNFFRQEIPSHDKSKSSCHRGHHHKCHKKNRHDKRTHSPKGEHISRHFEKMNHEFNNSWLPIPYFDHPKCQRRANWERNQQICMGRSQMYNPYWQQQSYLEISRFNCWNMWGQQNPYFENRRYQQSCESIPSFYERSHREHHHKQVPSFQQCFERSRHQNHHKQVPSFQQCFERPHHKHHQKQVPSFQQCFERPHRQHRHSCPFGRNPDFRNTFCETHLMHGPKAQRCFGHPKQACMFRQSYFKKQHCERRHLRRNSFPACFEVCERNHQQRFGKSLCHEKPKCHKLCKFGFPSRSFQMNKLQGFARHNCRKHMCRRGFSPRFTKFHKGNFQKICNFNNHRFHPRSFRHSF